MNATIGRLALLGASTLLASACVGGSKYDGMYRVIFEFSDGESNYEASFPEAAVYEGFITVYTTSSGELAIAGLDALLTGPRDGMSFETTAEYGYTSNICDRYAYQQTWQLEGDFTSDLGIDATATYEENQAQSGCEFYEDAETQYMIEFDVSGIQLKSTPGRHPGEASNWGYVPSFGGSAGGSSLDGVPEEG